MNQTHCKQKRRRLGALAAGAALAFLLTGCANVEPFDYTATSEIPPGRGLFSGEDGAFTLSVPYGDGSAEAPMSDQQRKRR